MSESYRAQVGSAFEVLAEGLAPFVDQRMAEAFPGDDWILDAATRLGKRPDVLVSVTDPHFQLEVMNRWWGPTFAPVLNPSARQVVGELRTARNHWAHPDEDQPIDLDYALRIHANCDELLRAIGSSDADRIALLTDDLRWESARRTARREGISETDVLIGQVADLQKQYDELQHQLTEAQSQAQTATGRSRAFARQLAELQTQYAAVAGLRDRYRALQQQLEGGRTGDEDRATVDAQLSDAQLALDSLQGESERLRGELTAARQAMSSLNPTDLPAGRRWIWLATALILLLGVMVVVAYYLGRASVIG